MISLILTLKYQCKVHTKAILNKHTHKYTIKSATIYTTNYITITTPNKPQINTFFSFNVSWQRKVKKNN